MDDDERARHEIEGELAGEFIQRVFDERTQTRLTLGDERHMPDDQDCQPVIMLERADGRPAEPWTVEVEVRLRRWLPVGWTRPPQFGPGDIVMVNGPAAHRWQVREVLGTDEDPRPGYVLDFVTSLDPFDHQDTGRIALPDEVFAVDPFAGPKPTKAADDA